MKRQNSNSVLAALMIATALSGVAQAQARAPAVQLPAQTLAQSETAAGGEAKATPSAKSAKPRRKRVAKAGRRNGRKPASARKVAAARKPASQPEMQVFDMVTSFESMLDQRKRLEREPAALSPMARVIGVRRDLGLTDTDSSKASRDIVLNGGTGAGLSEGMILAVVRKIPVIDPYQANAQSELEVEFAKVKIVHAQSDISVARLESIEAIDFGLAVGTRAVLVGDFVTQSKK